MHVIKFATLKINGIIAPKRLGMLSDFIRRHELDVILVQEVTNPDTLNIREYDAWDRNTNDEGNDHHNRS